MSPALAREFFKFVTITLPNLLADHEDPVEALVKLGELWKAKRTEEIKDRSSEVEANRAEIDKKLADRKAKK